MIDGLMPYPAMKGSGVSWLGEVPAHWEVQRLRNVAEMRVSNIDKHTRDDELPVRLCNYVDVYKHDRIRSDMPFMRATATKSEIGRFRLLTGDVLITKDSEAWNDIGVPALVTDSAEDLVSGYHLALLRPIPGRLTGEYLLRVLQSTALQYQFHVRANGVTRYGLAHCAIKSALLPIAPLAEQAAISRFLNHADRRIRRYTRTKQNLIKLLEEQKQAIIHRAVTRGLDPSVRLKPSGVEWLGDVPEHWEVVRLGRFVEVITGFPFKSQGFTQRPEDVRLLRGVNISPEMIRWTDVVRWPQSERDKYRGFELRVGDIALGMDRPLIRSGTRVATVRESDVPALLLQRVARIRAVRGLRGDFLLLVLAGKLFGDYLAPIFTGITVPHLSPDQIKSFLFAMPTDDVQKDIVRWAAERTREICAAVVDAEREISLLREYRTRLISDVVTGKLDVRAAAAALPEGGDEVEPADEVESESEDSEADAEEAEPAPEETDA